MSSLDYLVLLPPIIAAIGIGRRFVKRDLFSALIAGLLVLASMASPLAYWQVAWVRPVILLGLVGGLVFAARDCLAAWRERRSDLISWRAIAAFLIAFSFFLVFFRGLHFRLYVFESHDLVYFSWINEMLAADYLGPIRVGVAWPNLMASNHLLPGAMIAALSAFLPHPTLVTSIEIRYLLVAASFAYFLVTLMPRELKDAALFGILFLLLFSIYREEITYELRISSFAYIIVLFAVLKRVFTEGAEDRELVFFAIFLTIAKAPIFFVAGSLAAWLLLKAPRSRFAWTTVCAAVLAFLNMGTWAWVVPPGGRTMSWSIAHPFNMTSMAYLNGVSGVSGWMMPDTITEILKHFFVFPFLTLPMVLYVIVKYYVVYFATVNHLYSAKTTTSGVEQLSTTVKLQGLDIFMLVSLSAWVFVRNGQDGINHQAHAFLLGATVAMAVLLRALTLSPSRARFGVAMLFALLFATRVNVTDPFERWKVSLGSPSTLPYSPTLNLSRTADGFYHPPAGENPGISQVKAAMAGLRLSATEVPPPQDSQIYHWIQR